MANICENTFYAASDKEENITYIHTFLEDKLDAEIYGESNEDLEACFDSKWSFPEELMDELYEGLPDKSDIYMRCLSVEYGCDYVAYHKCDEDGWTCIV